ncbi:hypothetical protein NQ318_021881 [Aromia moschata]|uniref:Saposin B-type domain-containing protein n=1 Tax=Aromia moschata TaxID=1265417 RepID=A0AAV8Z868_9CUCU|nr:hypothetical protein NQ318_021881 [Aromia moschata]
MANMGLQAFAVVILFVGSYASNINPDNLNGFELAAKALTEYLHTGKHPVYLESALRNYPLYTLFRSNPEVEDIDNSEVCILCEILVNALVVERRKGMTNVQLSAEASYFCEMLQIENRRVCDGVIDNNVDIFTYIVDNNPTINGQKICGLILHNYDCRGSTMFDWTIDIPEGKTVEKVKKLIFYPIYELKNERGDTASSASPDEPPLPSGTKSFNILHLSDIHYDPHYTTAKTNQCGEPLCCQDDQAFASSAEDSCGFWGDYTNADTPINTMLEALDHINKTQCAIVSDRIKSSVTSGTIVKKKEKKDEEH